MIAVPFMSFAPRHTVDRSEMFRLAKVYATDLARRRDAHPGQIGPSGIRASDRLWAVCQSLKGQGCLL